MSAAVIDVKTEVQPQPNGPKPDENKKKGPGGDGVMKFQGSGNRNQGFGNRGGRGGNRGGRYNDNKQNNFRGGQRQQNNQNSGPKAELMNLDLPHLNSDGKLGGGGGGHQGNQGNDRQRRPYNRGNDRGPDDRFAERIATISGPTIELPPIDNKEKKFGGRCRLYVGNLTNDVTKEELEELFAPYGETSECFINAEKMFSFIRVDYRANAEKAKRELDGSLRKGRQLRVRFAPHSAAVKVRNLNQFVTNELLEWAFQVFGEIERAVVIADERGKSTGEGIVEFARKPGAMQALRRCTEGCYFVTGSLRPVIVEPYELLDEIDGYSEKSIFKKTPDFFKEREVGPRFAAPGSFEADYGQRWKALSDLYKQKEEGIKREMKLEEEKLEAQMEYARYEHETEMLRAQLKQREQDKERQMREWELKERAADDARRSDEERIRRQAEEMKSRLLRQDEEQRRRVNEVNLFSQASQLTSLLEKHEQALASPFGERSLESRGLTGPPPLSADPKAFLDAFDGRQGGRAMGRNDQRPPRWSSAADRRGPPGPEDYQNKRRRY